MRTAAAAALAAFAVCCAACGGPTATAPANPVPVGGAALCRAALADKGGAEREYKGKVVELSGVIESTGRNAADGPYVVLAFPGGKYRSPVWFGGGQESAAAALAKGQTLSVRGRVDGFSVARDEVMVQLVDCTIISVSK